MSAVFTSSKESGRKDITAFVGRWGGAKGGIKEAHKHLCSSVGGYEINPPPNGGRIYMRTGLGEGWRRKRREKVSSHRLCSSSDMAEAPRAEPFNSQKEKPLIRRIYSGRCFQSNSFCVLLLTPPLPPRHPAQPSCLLVTSEPRPQRRRATAGLHQPSTVSGAA